MLLIADIGNSNVKFALANEEGILERWRIATDSRRTADEYATWLAQIFALSGYDIKSVKALILSSVVPRAVHNFSILAEKYLKADFVVAGRGDFNWDIKLNVEEPSSVGTDRIVNAIAAQLLCKMDKIVISFGTATTFDHIGSDGSYNGGSIAPGINLSLDGLYSATAQLPNIAITDPENDNMLGKTTEAQMQIGIFWGSLSLIEGMISRMKAQIGKPVQIIATGGMAYLFQKQHQIFDFIDPDLTLKGLSCLYYNKIKG
ncbi:pantothenate kinase [Sphingorhabdus lutea]|uniref:Type III pantothenate kinase n=1 Tax=Sphingorhabdus lutea TaxID=1913578 RepID=A0A1L3JBV0_9SPHN|nr:type III pantothenate kinase [Sphingorhabdus lutea]APG62601.1 pantothenate kinase [Sphingorhabdus lutea]